MERKVYFESEIELERYVACLKIISSGSEGTCYRLNDKEVFKYLNGPYSEEYVKEEFEQFRDFSNTYIFSTDAVMVGNAVRACIMPFVVGLPCFVKDCNTSAIYNFQNKSYSKLVEKCQIVESDTRIISDLGILGYDICDSNILCGDKQFYVIDTAKFSHSELDASLVYKRNMYSFFSDFISRMFSSAELRFLYKNPRFCRFLEDIDALSNPIVLLEEIRAVFSEYCGFEIKTLQSVHKILLKKK